MRQQRGLLGADQDNDNQRSSKQPRLDCTPPTSSTTFHGGPVCQGALFSGINTFTGNTVNIVINNNAVRDDADPEKNKNN